MNAHRPADSWVQTYTGRRYWPHDPSPDDVDIEDIAHALSNLCRYTGHCSRFYCPTPDQRVLTADLRWTPAGDLRVGDALLGFDEHATQLGSAGKRRRRFRPSIVTYVQAVKRPIVRLELADGSEIRASAEHPWLVATKVSGNQTWRTATKIYDDCRAGRRRYMHKFMEPWSDISGRDAGWLAGIWDGEGHLSVTNRGGVQSGVAQKPGLVLDEIGRLMREFGFGTGRHCQTGNPGSGVMTLSLDGGWRHIAEFLGSVRPIRLLDKFTHALAAGGFAKQMEGCREPMAIVAAYKEPEAWVAGIETSTHTYLCEGFAAHNSIAEHSVHVSNITGDLDGLLHDAREAYTQDLATPTKRYLPDYLAMEDRNAAAVAKHFGIAHPTPRHVKTADQLVYWAERRQLMLRHPAHTQPPDVPHITLPPLGLAPVAAKALFLARYSALLATR